MTTANFVGSAAPAPFGVALYFGSPPHSLYQLEPWLDPLSQLAQRIPVGILVRDLRVFRSLQQRTDLPLVFVDSYRELSDLVEASLIKLTLYTNHASSNYQMLRFNDMLHVHIGHGESEKAYMAANQVKAYDYVLVAGPAAEQRLQQRLYRFGDEKVVQIGRPQIATTSKTADGIPVVLYAPTYEGDIAGSSYSSLHLFGVEMVRSLIESERFHVVYRPHPLTGVHEPDLVSADRQIRQLITSKGHTVDEDTPLIELMGDADILIGDKSSVIVDWLAQDRPYLVTDVIGEQNSPFFDAGTVVTEESAANLIPLVDEALSNDVKSEARRKLANHHLGDSYGDGSAMLRFISTIEELIAERDRWITDRVN